MGTFGLLIFIRHHLAFTKEILQLHSCALLHRFEKWNYMRESSAKLVTAICSFCTLKMATLFHLNKSQDAARNPVNSGFKPTTRLETSSKKEKRRNCSEFSFLNDGPKLSMRIALQWTTLWTHFYTLHSSIEICFHSTMRRRNFRTYLSKTFGAIILVHRCVVKSRTKKMIA